jgi:3-carboxy-cis,cis-muconate cycloisomerase
MDMLHDLPDAFHRTERLTAVLAGDARVRRMLDVEVALARAEARVGLITDADAVAIAEGAARVSPDIPAMARASALGGVITLPVVAALREATDAPAADHVHLGATSQDIIDTALVLQLRDALVILREDLEGAATEAARLAAEYRTTPMAGRTLLQQAVPITFGLKSAGWLGGLTQLRRDLDHVSEQVLVLQFGGAAGTLASLGEHGLAVTDALGDELGLPVPPLPWHGDRTRIGGLVGWLATASGFLSKIANDLILLMQHEVGEVLEAGGEGKGRSSAMPQKRNPVETLAIRMSGQLARGRTTTLFASMEQEHERAVGGWQTEWTALPDAVHLVGSMLERTRSTLGGLQVDVARMHANLEATLGLPMAEALATALGRELGAPAAYRLVSSLTERVSREQRHLREVAHDDPQVQAVLTVEEVDRALAPDGWLGCADTFIERALTAWQQLGE